MTATHRPSQMLAEDRQRAILERVETNGAINIRELAEELGVAAVTLRVDVRELARQGRVGRVHGGATRVSTSRDGGTDRVETTTSGPSVETPPSYTLGMLVPHRSYYYPHVVEGARDAARRLGAKLVLSVSRYTSAEERAQVDQMLQTGVDGLLLTTHVDPQTSPETEAWLRSLPVPVVLTERRAGPDTGDVEYVASDHEYGAHLAVRHLAALGRRRIGLLTFPTMTSPMLERGYDRALVSHGLPSCAPTVPRELAENDPVDFEHKSRQLIAAVRHGDVDALLIHNDSIAIPLVSRLRAADISIPDDLAVMTYDDELAALADPPLTAVAPPRQAVGAGAVELLVRRLQDPDRPLHHVILRPTLEVRESCGGGRATLDGRG